MSYKKGYLGAQTSEELEPAVMRLLLAEGPQRFGTQPMWSCLLLFEVLS